MTEENPQTVSDGTLSDRVAAEYETPTVSDHGSIQDLTLGGAAFGSDGLGSNATGS